jgi:pSer/pThr/pTyr-binding forkhead associated (FHA) protein
VIRDMSSWHGTFLNGKKIDSGTRIEPGDVIGVGSFQIKVVGDDCTSKYAPKSSGPVAPPVAAPVAAPEPTKVKEPEPAKAREPEPTKVKEPEPEPESVAPRGMRLRVFRGETMIDVVQVESDPISIGRLKSNTINDDSLDIERRHAVVEKDVLGTIRVIDRGSLYGTQVNGKQIERNAVIKDGDVLVVGHLTIRVEGNYSSPEPEPKVEAESKPEPEADVDEMKAATAAFEAMGDLVKAAADMPVSAVTHVKAKCWDELMDFMNDKNTNKDDVGAVIRTIRKIFGQ